MIRYFANIAEAGLSASVAARASRLSAILGSTRYLLAFWMTLPGFRLATVRLDADGRVLAGNLIHTAHAAC